MRRLTNPRIRATSTTADILILCILLIQCALGLTTIPFSAQHPDGSEMLKLVDWAQAVVTFHGSASAHLDGVAWIYRVHPGARNDHLSDLPLHPPSVHVWSAPVEYFTRRYRGGTLPALSAGGVYHSSLPVARTRPSRQIRVFIVPDSRLYAGWRLRLIRPTGPLTGSNLTGPRKRSAAGQDIRHGTCIAGWRLSPYPAYRVLSQAQTP